MVSRFEPGQTVEAKLSDAPWRAATVLSVEPVQQLAWGPESSRWGLRYTVQIERTGSVFTGRTDSEVRTTDHG